MIFIVGVNGAGKSSLREDISHFVNFSDYVVIDPDQLAKKYKQNVNTDIANIKGGRDALNLFEKSINEKKNIIMESTLSGKSILTRYKTAKENGYSISTYYVGLDSLKMHQDRVKNRVKLGGHDIDSKLIEKRFNSSKDNLYKAMEISDQVVIYDNSDITINRSAIINNKIKLMSVHSNKHWVNDIVTNYNMDKDLNIVVQLEQPIKAKDGANMANENVINTNTEINANAVLDAASKNFHRDTVKELSDLVKDIQAQGATVKGNYDEKNLTINLNAYDAEKGTPLLNLSTKKMSGEILVNAIQTKDEFLFQYNTDSKSMDKALIVEQVDVQKREYAFNQDLDAKSYFDKNVQEQLEKLGFKTGTEFQNTKDIYMVSLTKQGSNADYITSLINTPNGRNLSVTEFSEVKNQENVLNTNNAFIFNQSEIEKGQINFDTKAFILAASDKNSERSERSLFNTNDLSILNAQKDNVISNGTNMASVIVVDTAKDRYSIDANLNVVDYKKDGKEQENTTTKNQLINETELNISKPKEQHFTERLSSIHHHYSSVLSGENIGDIKKGSFVYAVNPQTFETQQYKFNESYNMTSVTKLPLLGVSVFDKDKNDYVLAADLQPKEVVTKPLDKAEIKELVTENQKLEQRLGINHEVKQQLGFEETLPASVKGSYLVQEHKNLLDKTYSFYDKSDTKLPAFESNKNTLETTKEDHRTISAMIQVAKSQNWNSVKITGTEEFRREAWLQASLAGIEVKGYKPKENDLMELKARNELLEKNTIVGFTKEQELIKEPTTTNKEQIGTTESVNAAPRTGLSATAEYSDKTVEPESKAAKDFTISGKINDFGYAPYPDKPNSNSFFVEVTKDDGTTTKAWGLALADQLSKNDLIKGDTVNLHKLDGEKTDVSLPTKVKDANGNVSGIQEKIYTVQAWNIDVIEKVSERPAPNTDKGLTKDDHKEIEKNQYKLTEKQISFFANKLVHDDTFASKFSVAGESYQAFESRISKNLHDENKVKEYSKYLQSMGLMKEDHKANLQSNLSKLGAKPEIQERILKTFDNATNSPTGARTIEQAKPQSVEITKQKSNDSKERER
ncbi:LPD7 domain-containing protein [Acinetobacter pittii]|nr:LPD7 domain-containing protein [Acinetobacter pittii]